MQHPIANAVTLSTIAGILDQPHEGVALGGLADNIRRGIVRSVIDYDYLSVPPLLDDVVTDALQAGSQALGFVICGYDDAVLGHQLGSGVETIRIRAASSETH